LTNDTKGETNARTCAQVQNVTDRVKQHTGNKFGKQIFEKGSIAVRPPVIFVRSPNGLD
jgi:hypothetical protein